MFNPTEVHKCRERQFELCTIADELSKCIKNTEIVYPQGNAKCASASVVRFPFSFDQGANCDISSFGKAARQQAVVNKLHCLRVLLTQAGQTGFSD